MSRKLAEGPTELVRGGTVIETERGFVIPAGGAGVPDGEDALGLLFRFSEGMSFRLSNNS